MMSRGDDARLVDQTANRLRMIQVDFADEGEDVRSQFLGEALEQCLEPVPAPERPAFLASLLERFPGWDGQVDVSSKVEQSATTSAVDARELRDASFLVSRLIDVVPTLSESERQVLSDRLATAGLGSRGRAGWDEKADELLRSRLSLGDADMVDPGRVAESVDLFAEFVLGLERVAWKTWQEIAPRSKIKGGGLDRKLKRFTTGDPDVVRSTVKTDLERLRQLVAALILGIRHASGEFGQKHMTKLSPSAIERLIQYEKKRFMEGEEVRCWKKYQELCETMDERTIEREIMQAVASYATRMMEGSGG